MFFVEMEVGLMEIVQSVNRSWIYDSYFSLYRPIHPGEMSVGELSKYRLKLVALICLNSAALIAYVVYFGQPLVTYFFSEALHKLRCSTAELQEFRSPWLSFLNFKITEQNINIFLS